MGVDVDKVPLTLNHFLAGQGNQGLGSRVLEDPDSVSVETLSLRHQEMLQRQEDFWRIWSSEYLRSLPAAFQKFKKAGNIQVGSVVLIREDNMPRMKWCVGVIQNLHHGVDGLPRAADIKTSSGVKTRAIQRLYNLEIESEGSVEVDVDSIDNDTRADGVEDVSDGVDGVGGVEVSDGVDGVEGVDVDNDSSTVRWSRFGRGLYKPNRLDYK